MALIGFYVWLFIFFCSIPFIAVAIGGLITFFSWLGSR